MIRRMELNRSARAVPDCRAAAFGVSRGGGDGEKRSVSRRCSRVGFRETMDRIRPGGHP
jgi:hypothetical protein